MTRRTHHVLREITCHSDNETVFSVDGSSMHIRGLATYDAVCECGWRVRGDSQRKVEEDMQMHVVLSAETCTCNFCGQPIGASVAYRVTSADTGAVAFICPEHVSPEPDLDFVRQDLVALERELRT